MVVLENSSLVEDMYKFKPKILCVCSNTTGDHLKRSKRRG
jgi:hypothetical protein